MRFTSVFVAGAFAVAAQAQSTTEGDVPSPTYSMDPVQSSILSCINECDPADVNCLADCNPVPSPNESQVIDTNECFAECDQGDGSEEQTEAYANCTQQCIQDLFFTDGEGTPNSGDDSNSDSSDTTTSAPESTETSDDSEDSETTGTDGAEPTESGASPTESGSEDDSEETSTETTEGAPDATETEDGGSGATALVGSALVGALALMLAL
jgi:cobalamin biosynthesis Mg chelatase CobN